MVTNNEECDLGLENGGSLCTQDCKFTPLGAWIDGSAGGWCSDVYNELMNMCGDVMFCAQAGVLKQYPDGIDVDVGFHWDAMEGGILLDVGGDCGQKRLTITVDQNGNVGAAGPLDTDVLAGQIDAGTHLISYHVDGTDNALFIDGELVDQGAGGGGTPELLGSCGPGFVLGQRISYWWEMAQMADWLRGAPFFVHLKGKAGTVDTWSFDEATAKTADTILLSDPSGVAGPNWKATEGTFDGLATNGATWEDDVWANCF